MCISNLYDILYTLNFLNKNTCLNTIISYLTFYFFGGGGIRRRLIGPQGHLMIPKALIKHNEALTLLHTSMPHPSILGMRISPWSQPQSNSVFSQSGSVLINSIMSLFHVELHKKPRGHTSASPASPEQVWRSC